MIIELIIKLLNLFIANTWHVATPNVAHKLKQIIKLWKSIFCKKNMHKKHFNKTFLSVKINIIQITSNHITDT